MYEDDMKQLVKVELGCGPNKHNGYIGVDRYDLPGVDIVADMNKRLPFDDNSVDVILAIHSLEHLEDLHHIMSEIYRICKHKAIVNIIAPYENQSSNIANLYHKIPFNEHTFRFFTIDKIIPPPFDKMKIYYEIPSLGNLWGLSESDYSSQIMDFRVLNQELIFYPEYNDFDDEVKMMLLQNFRNICSMIQYSLLVCKSEVNDEELNISKKQADKLMKEISQYQILKQSWQIVKYDRNNIIKYLLNKIYEVEKKYNKVIEKYDELFEAHKIKLSIDQYIKNNKKYNILEIIKMIDEEYLDDILLNNDKKIIKNLVLQDNAMGSPYSEWFIDNKGENSSIALFMIVPYKTEFMVEVVADDAIVNQKKYSINKSGVLWVDIPHTESKIYIRIACINKYDTFSTLVLRNNSNKIFYIGDNCKKYM